MCIVSSYRPQNETSEQHALKFICPEHKFIYYALKSNLIYVKQTILDPKPTNICILKRITNQRTIGPENAHLKHDLGAFSDNEMTLNNLIPLLTSLVVSIGLVAGLRLQ